MAFRHLGLIESSLKFHEETHEKFCFEANLNHFRLTWKVACQYRKTAEKRKQILSTKINAFHFVTVVLKSSEQY